MKQPTGRGWQPTLFLFKWELMAMPEYSYTLPTGKTIGKFWRWSLRRFAAVQPDGRTMYVGYGWGVACYAEHLEPNTVAILRFNVVLRHGPRPERWLE